jgi:hypothetical protein
MGNVALMAPGMALANQTSVVVHPTNTVYTFAAGPVELTATFTSPAFDHDKDIAKATRPITHITYSVRATDGSEHDVQIYYDNSGEGAVQKTSEQVVGWQGGRAVAQLASAAIVVGTAVITLRTAGNRNADQ